MATGIIGVGTEVIRKRRRRLLVFMVSCAGLLAALLICLFIQFDRNLTPSALVVHANPGAWQRVDLDQQTFTVSSRSETDVRISPINHGRHLIRIQFADGQTFWASYFHLDAGMRGCVDVYVSHLPGSPSVTLKCVIHNRPAILFRSETAFEGVIKASETSFEHPVVLSGV